MSSLSTTMAAAGTSEGLDSEDITNTAISQDSENIYSKDSLENSVDADISLSTESHTAEIFLASVGLQPSSRDQKESQETPKLLESKPMEQNNSGLPPGWKKIYVQRTSGKTAGKYDAYIFSPDGRKHRSKTELFAYLEKKNLAGQYNINEFDFTIRDVHVADGADASTSSTPASQTKAERKRLKALTPKQIRMSEAGSKKSKKHKSVGVSPEISPSVKKLVETSSKKSKKRKMEPSESEPSSTPSVFGVKKFKKMKAESEKSELSHFRKKVKSPPRLKLPMKKLKIKLKFSIPAKREKVLPDNTTNEADVSAAPDSLTIKIVDAESHKKTFGDAVSDVSEKDLFDRSLSEDVSFETIEKELQESCLNDGCSETDGKELHDRSTDEASSDLNESQHRSLSCSVEEMVEEETQEGSRTEATTSISSCTKNSLSSKSRDDASSSPLPDSETPSHISEMLLDNNRTDSENGLSDDNDVDERNDEGSADVSNSFSTFSSSHSKITAVTKTNAGGKVECNNNSPKHTGSDRKVEPPLPTEDVGDNSSEFNRNNVEQRLKSDDNVVVPKKWYPPQSPYNLIEEQLDNDPWKVLVVSIFIESGDVCYEAGSLPRKSVKAFLKLCPSPKRVRQYGRKRIFRGLEEHGISKKTVAKILKFSEEYLSNPGDDPSSLYGIGKYGQDTYRIFCINEWKQVVPDNRKLKEYHRWLWRNHRVFCKQ